MNWKGCRRKWSLPNLRQWYGVFFGGLRRSMENLKLINANV
jgi:hypothetical protein